MPYSGEQRVSRLRTSGSVAGSWAANGGTYPTVVEDDVDTTYMLGPGRALASYGSYLRNWMDVVTLASNERCVQYRARVKMKVNDSGGSTRKTGMYVQIREQGSLSNPTHPANYWTYIPTVTPAKEYAGTWRTRTPSGKELTAAQLGATVVQCIDNTATSFTSGQRVRVTEVYLDYIVNRRPFITGQDVIDEDLSTTPLVVWTYNDTDGDPQYRAQVKVFGIEQVNTPGFSPDKTIPIYDSGLMTTQASDHRIQKSLTNGKTYRAYVRVSQQLGDLGEWWSDWAFVSVVISLIAPPSPTVTNVGYESAQDRVVLQLRGRLNDLLDIDSSFESGTVGNWSNSTNATISNSSAWAASGTKSLQLSSIAAGDMEAMVGSFAASAGRVYWARATVRAATVARQVRVRITWLDAAFAAISTIDGTAVLDATASDTDLILQDATAPAGTRWRQLKVRVLATGAAGEIHRVDKAATGPGSGTPPTWHPGGLTDPTLTGYEMQYADMVREGNMVHPNLSSGGGYFESTDGFYPRNGTDTIEISSEVAPYLGDWSIRWVPMTTGSIIDIGSRVGEVDPYIWAVTPGKVYESSMKVRPYSGTFLCSVRFVYTDATGTAVQTVGVENVTVGPGWTEVVVPDTTAPVGSVFCRGQIENKSGIIEVPLFIDDVQFGELDHPLTEGDPGQGELLLWKPWRKSVDVTTGDTSAIIINQDLVAAQESNLFDHEVPPNKTRLYRLRAVSLVGGLEVASVWSTILPVSIALGGNWLKYPYEPSLNFQPRINGFLPMERSYSLRRGIHDIVGRATPVVITGMPSSEAFDLELVVEKESDWHKLYAMALSDGPLLLRTPGRQWWVQALGEPEQRDYTVRTLGQSYYRAVSVSFVEVAEP